MSSIVFDFKLIVQLQGLTWKLLLVSKWVALTSIMSRNSSVVEDRLVFGYWSNRGEGLGSQTVYLSVYKCNTRKKTFDRVLDRWTRQYNLRLTDVGRLTTLNIQTSSSVRLKDLLRRGRINPFCFGEYHILSKKNCKRNKRCVRTFIIVPVLLILFEFLFEESPPFFLQKKKERYVELYFLPPNL